MKDSHGRTIDYLRISLTDRCNFRCIYCMPEDGVQSLAHEDILRIEEIEQAMRDFDYAASGYRLDLTPGRVFYFYHDCARFFKYVRPVCRA